jgi:hypothetical protein
MSAFAVEDGLVVSND